MKIITPSRFTAIAKIIINGQVVTIHGEGSLDSEKGTINGQYDVANMPDEIDPLILKTVMITGYPSVCAGSVEKRSPFVQGDYSYHRRLEFEDHGHLTYDADCRFETDETDGEIVLISEFHGEGELAPLELEKSGGVTEMWLPNDNGINGRFDVAFKKKSGGDWLIGKALSNYHFSAPIEMGPGSSHRHITFPHASYENGTLQLNQESRLL